MLWTDSPTNRWITVDDLVSIDPEVPRIAQTEGVVLTGRAGVIFHGIGEAGMRVQSLSQSFEGYLSYGNITAQHMAAVLFGSTWQNHLRFHLGQVVVTTGDDWTNLKHWVSRLVLRRFYQAVIERKMPQADRYQTKFDRCDSEIQRLYEPMLFNVGMPVVEFPILAPGSREPGAGSWSKANISSVAGGADLEREYDIAISYVSGSYVSQAVKKNSESAHSDVVTFVCPASNYLSIDITSLTPLNTQPEDTQYWSIYSPRAVTGWNVWVGAHGQTMYLQNASPIPIATKTYAFSGTPTLSGYVEHQGQHPDSSYTINRTLMRG